MTGSRSGRGEPGPGVPDSARARQDIDDVAATEYHELRTVAHRLLRHRRGGALAPGTTSLVHEAFLRLKESGHTSWNDRTHFLAVATTQIRHLLVEHARAADAQKRGGGFRRISFEDGMLPSPDRTADVLALDEALRGLARLSTRRHRVAELRLFAGLTVEEISDLLRVSPRTVKEDWRVARAWLARQLESAPRRRP